MRNWTAAIALLLLISGCSRAPGPTPQRAPTDNYAKVNPAALTYTEEEMSEAATVAYVTMRQKDAAAGMVRPLWGDVEADRGKIAHLLHLLKEARPVTDPVSTWQESDLAHMWWLVVRYLDGREVRIREVQQRQGSNTYVNVPGRMYMDGTGEVTATGLEAFWRGTAVVRRPDLLPPVSNLSLEPQRPSPGGKLTVRGEGWVEKRVATISLVEAGTEARWPLGEVQIKRGAFVWEGTLPPDLTPGVRWKYAVDLVVDGAPSYRSPIQILIK